MKSSNFVLSALIALVSVVLAGTTQAASVTGYHFVKSTSIPGDEGWDYISADSQNHCLYISRSSRVVVFDTAKSIVLGEISNTTGVHGIVVDPKSGHGFTSDGRDNTVTMFNTKNLQTLRQIPVGEGPDGILFDPATERVFTFNGRGQTATAINGQTGDVVGTVVLPGRPEFPVSDGSGKIYDNIEDQNEIVAIDAKTLAITNTWPVAPGEGPSGLSCDAKNHRLFSVCDNQKMVVVDTTTGKVVSTLTIGNGPDACAFDPAKKLVFSPNGADGTVSIYHETSPDAYDLIQTLNTQTGARTIALDTKTHHIFTVTATPKAPTPGTPSRRRSYQPGTFVVLEYAP